MEAIIRVNKSGSTVIVNPTRVPEDFWVVLVKNYSGGAYGQSVKVIPSGFAIRCIQGCRIRPPLDGREHPTAWIPVPGRADGPWRGVIEDRNSTLRSGIDVCTSRHCGRVRRSRCNLKI